MHHHIELRQSIRMLKLIFYALIALVLLWATNCQSPERPINGGQPAGDAQPTVAARPAEPMARTVAAPPIDEHGLHVLNHSRLADIMRDLKAMDFAAISEEISATSELSRDICDVSRHAAALAADAHIIPILFEDHDMSPESRRVLNMMAARMHLQALELQDAADRGNVSLVRDRLDRMIQTCNDCHHSFRAPPVASLDNGRVQYAMGESR